MFILYSVIRDHYYHRQTKLYLPVSGEYRFYILQEDFGGGIVFFRLAEVGGGFLVRPHRFQPQYINYLSDMMSFVHIAVGQILAHRLELPPAFLIKKIGVAVLQYIIR